MRTFFWIVIILSVVFAGAGFAGDYLQEAIATYLSGVM